MSFRGDQEKVLELHALWRRTWRKPNTLTLPKEESNSISKFHTRQMDANARSCANTEGMEGSLGHR
jgi:hypothetical protein